MKDLLIIAVMFLGLLNSFSANAQQEPQFIQFKDNLLSYNPGYAGSRGMLNFSTLYRKQWSGFKGAPESTNFYLHSPIKYESIGLGMSFLTDRSGPLSQSWLNVDFSYGLKFTKDRKLAFGVKGGINILNASLIELAATDMNDPSLSENYTTLVKPNFGTGIYYSSKQFYAGISVPKILQQDDRAYIDNRHYYAMAGGYVSLNRMLKYSPSVLLKVTNEAPFSLDISNSLIVYDRFWFGVNYKLDANVGAYFQFLLNNQFKMGLAYEIETTELVNYNAGSFEVMMSYDLNYLKKNISNPRYF